MTIIFGAVTNYDDVQTIKTNGKPCKVTEHRLDRDGFGYDYEVDGYEYDGKQFTIGTDRDGWPIAWVKE